MYEEYPSEEESRTMNFGEGDIEELSGNILADEVRGSNDPNQLIEEEGGFNTVAYYNAVGALIHGIEFVELADFPRTATYTVGEDGTGSGNFYERGKMIYDLVNGSQEINNMPASYQLREAEANDLAELNPLVEALFERIRNFFGGEEEIPVRENQFKQLAEKITIRDIKSLRGKNEVYEYWEKYYNAFMNIKPINVSLTDEVASEFNSTFKKVKIPCIVVQHTDANFEQEGGRFGLMRMANEILMGNMGMTPSQEYQSAFGEDFTISADTDRAASADGEVGEETGRTGYIDVKVKDNIDDIEMVMESLDPLTFLNLTDEGIIYLGPEGETIAELKDKIMSYLPQEYNNLSPTALGYLADAVEEAINDYVSLVDKKEKYFLPMLDNHITEMNKIPIAGGYTFSYYTVKAVRIGEEEGEVGAMPDFAQLQAQQEALAADENTTHQIIFELKQEPAEVGYSTLVGNMNDAVETLLGVINKNMVVGKKKRFIQNVPKAEQGPSSAGSGQRGALGARYPSMPGSLASLGSSVGLDPLLDLIYKLFVEDIDFRYFFNKDYPEFTTKGNYVSFKSAYASSKNKKGTALSRQVARFPFTAIDEEELRALNNLFGRLRKGSTARIGELIKQAENTIQPFLLLNLSLESSRADKTRLQKEITDSLGRIIYEFSAMQGRERLTEFVFAGKQIQEYANSEIVDSHINILPELENEDFLQTLNDDEAALVKSIKRKITGNFLRDILNTNDSTDIENSLLKAVDIMRQSNGISVYRAHLDLANIEDVITVSDLIRKEDRVDLYAQDMETILNSPGKTFDELSVQLGVSRAVIYKVRGLFR